MVTYVYLSPHLDDGVFSCGGMIHRQTRAGERVVVITLCAGDPPPGPLSDFARTLHERWSGRPLEGQRPRDVVALRRREDIAALRLLGAEAVHLHLPDCIYRADPATGAYLYTSQEALVGVLSPAEHPLAERMAAALSQQLRSLRPYRFYSPLAIGHHVDHQLARGAAELMGGVYAYFEDYPYAAWEAEASTATPARAAQGRALSAEIVPLAQADLEAKVRAMTAYASQISSFWEDAAAMTAAVRRFAEHTGGGSLAERVWRGP
jgi:LmbE family N-acetylglucosaminyl deacetylase